MRAYTEIQSLLDWHAGWNGYDALTPTRLTVEYASSWITKLFSLVSELERPWLEPNVTAGANGEVVLEWWHDAKKLTVYIQEQRAEYVQMWGSNTDIEMADGDADSISACRSIWNWLIKETKCGR